MLEHIAERELLLALDGELPDERSQAVHQHLGECAVCESHWSRLTDLSRQVAPLVSPEVVLRPQEAALAELLVAIDAGRGVAAPPPRRWISRPFAIANTLAAVAIAVTCVALLPTFRASNRPAARAAVTYDLEPAIPAGYVSLPFADPALPLDDATVLPVQLSADDLEMMGLDAADASPDGVEAEILIGMDGWPRAIRIVE